MHYYPILRGRQNELLAIRELAQQEKLDHVVPVIEPVRASSTLTLTLDALVKEGAEVYIVSAPKVGRFQREADSDFQNKYKLIKDSSVGRFRAAWWLDKELVQKLRYGFEIGPEAAVLASGNSADEFSEFLMTDGHYRPLFLQYGATMMGLVSQGRPIVRLDDPFHVQQRNSNYRSNNDELFMGDFQALQSMKSVLGFSDYSIVGAEYREGGFMPRAVAFHIVYESEGMLRVHHFISDEDKDGSDVGTMYENALEHFIDWFNRPEIRDNPLMNTLGAKELRASSENGTFPGLGALKKFTIMHHLELVNNILRSLD